MYGFAYIRLYGVAIAMGKSVYDIIDIWQQFCRMMTQVDFPHGMMTFARADLVRLPDLLRGTSGFHWKALKTSFLYSDIYFV